MSWIEDGTLPDWVAGFVNTVTMNQRVNAYLLDLAARVSDKGWTTLTVSAANFSAGPIPPQWRQIGSIVHFSGQIQRSVSTPADSTLNGSAIFSALPSSAWPNTQEVVKLASGTGGASISAQIGTDGTIQIRNDGTVALAASTNINLSGITYFAG